MATLDPREPLDRIAGYADAAVRVLNRRGSSIEVAGASGLEQTHDAHSGNRGNAVTPALSPLPAIGLGDFRARNRYASPASARRHFCSSRAPVAEVGMARNAIGRLVTSGAALAPPAVFGLLDAPGVYSQGVTAARSVALAFSVAISGGVLRLIRSADPLAGTTTIVVSAGLLARPHQLAAVVAGAVPISVAGSAPKRSRCVSAPAWAAPR